MTRLNLVLLAVLLVCSLSLVTSRHQARKLTTELTRVVRAFPSDEECAINPRARSAVLRVAERAA